MNRRVFFPIILFVKINKSNKNVRAEASRSNTSE